MVVSEETTYIIKASLGMGGHRVGRMTSNSFNSRNAFSHVYIHTIPG